MKMTTRKIFSIVMASIALFLFINMFIPHVDYGYGIKQNIWDMEGFRVICLFAIIAIIALYLLHLFINLNEKWVKYANYAVGYITISYLVMFFTYLDSLGFGLVIGVILALGLGTLSVLWYFMSDKKTGPKVTE